MAAAFIGPGTLTACTLAGATFGFSLLWVLLFSTLSTIILQEMTARLGLITQSGLGEALRDQLQHPLVRGLGLGLVFVAIIIGNAAYEAGNISGAALGLTGFYATKLWVPMIGLLAAAILFWGRYEVVEKVLIGLVILMSVVFLITAIVVMPSLPELIKGVFLPEVTSDNQWTVIALIGTTVVPYNLFLHAATISQKWKQTSDLGDLRIENSVAIGLGGLISMAIVVASATTIFGQPVTGISELAQQLEPLLGRWSRWFIAVGLFAAGVSSAITAPLAAAYAARGIFGWKGGHRSPWFRLIWFAILLIGTAFSMLGYQPVEVIRLAQVANGILLPVIVVFLLYICNKKALLGAHANKPWQNAFGIIVLASCLFISLRSLNSVFHFL